MNCGRVFDERGNPNQATACGRLLACFRGRTGAWIDGLVLDQEASKLCRLRAASTRKSEICSQIDPRVEWITREVRRGMDGPVQVYRHTWTYGKCPDDRMAQARLEEITAAAKAAAVPARLDAVHDQGVLFQVDRRPM